MQLYRWNWDQHGDSKAKDIQVALPQRCQETAQAAAALVKDLKQRGLLDSTLVVWGGEFGRTPMEAPILPPAKDQDKRLRILPPESGTASGFPSRGRTPKMLGPN